MLFYNSVKRDHKIFRFLARLLVLGAIVRQCKCYSVLRGRGCIGIAIGQQEDLARMRGKDGKDRPQDKKRLGCCILCAIMWVMGGVGEG